MVLESLVAIGAGVLAGSLALIAFGGDSIIELISSFAVLAYMTKLMRNPTSDPSELGAEGVERLTAFLLLVLLPTISFAAAYSFLVGHRPDASLPGIFMAIGAVIVMPLLWYEKRRIGRDANILPLSIDAIESATCFLMSVSLLFGLLVNFFFHVWWIDYVATAMILGFVAKEGREALSEIKTGHETS